MTKADVIIKLAEKTGIPKSDIQVIIESLFKLIQSAMLEDKSIQFKGFGKFVNKKRSKKLARNLADNTAIVIEGHYIPTLKLSKTFVKKIKKTVKVQSE